MRSLLIFISVFAIYQKCWLQTPELFTERRAITPAGGSFEDHQISINWTLGELAIETLMKENPDIVLTQGFQQPDEGKKDGPGNVQNVTLAELGLKVFPNPVHSTLVLEYIPQGKRNITVCLHDASGKILTNRAIKEGAQELDMKHLPAAIYFLQFSEGRRVYPGLKIVKKSK